MNNDRIIRFGTLEKSKDFDQKLKEAIEEKYESIPKEKREEMEKRWDTFRAKLTP